MCFKVFIRLADLFLLHLALSINTGSCRWGLQESSSKETRGNCVMLRCCDADSPEIPECRIFF